MKTFYWKCEIEGGKHIIGIEVEGNSFADLKDSERYLNEILKPNEKIISELSRKPRGFEWTEFRKPWAIIGTKIV